MSHWRDLQPKSLDRACADYEVDLAAGSGACDEAFKGQDVVVHLAGNPDPSAGFEIAARDNILATLTVLDGCLKHDVSRLIYASSVWADWPAWGLADKTTWYAASKMAGESLVRAWAEQTGRPAVCIRPGHFAPHVVCSPPNDECMRVDSAALCHRFDEALRWQGAGCKVIYALGRLASKTEAPANSLQAGSSPENVQDQGSL